MTFILYVMYRTPIFGHTDLYLNRWSVQLQMMSAFFCISITRWWRNWINNHYGILQFVDLSIADVFASTTTILQTGHLFPLFQVLNWILLDYVLPHNCTKTLKWYEMFCIHIYKYKHKAIMPKADVRNSAPINYASERYVLVIH